jgi:hypothetical protein
VAPRSAAEQHDPPLRAGFRYAWPRAEDTQPWWVAARALRAERSIHGPGPPVFVAPSVAAVTALASVTRMRWRHVGVRGKRCLGKVPAADMQRCGAAPQRHDQSTLRRRLRRILDEYRQPSKRPEQACRRNGDPGR